MIHWVAGCLLTMGSDLEFSWYFRLPWSLAILGEVFHHLFPSSLEQFSAKSFEMASQRPKKVTKIECWKVLQKGLTWFLHHSPFNKEQQTKILEASNAKRGLTMKGAWHPTTSLTCCCWYHALTTRHWNLIAQQGRRLDMSKSSRHFCARWISSWLYSISSISSIASIASMSSTFLVLGDCRRKEEKP